MIKNWRLPGNKAEQIDALASLVECYDEGICVDRDEKKANKFERKVAMLGDAGSQKNLSLSYAQGIGVKNNLAAASMWCGKAAAQRHAIQLASGMAKESLKTLVEEAMQPLPVCRRPRMC